MTLLEETEEKKSSQVIQPIYEVKEKHHDYFDENKVIRDLNNNKKEAIVVFDEIVYWADKYSGGTSEIDSTEIIDILLEALLFFVIDQNITSNTEKAYALEKVTQAAKIEALCCSIPVDQIFSEHDFYEEQYESGMNLGLNMIIQGSITGERYQCITNAREALCRFFENAEKLLLYNHIGDTWTGTIMPKFLLDKLIPLMNNYLNDMWDNMSPQERSGLTPPGN